MYCFVAHLANSPSHALFDGPCLRVGRCGAADAHLVWNSRLVAFLVASVVPAVVNRHRQVNRNAKHDVHFMHKIIVSR